MIFLDCPAYLDDNGAARCGLPAEVTARSTMHSTDGPLESAMIRCPVGHWFNAPIEFLAIDEQTEHPAAADRPAHDVTAQPARRPKRRPRSSRPRGTSAYYLGRHAGQWIRAANRQSDRPADRD